MKKHIALAVLLLVSLIPGHAATDPGPNKDSSSTPQGTAPLVAPKESEIKKDTEIPPQGTKQDSLKSVSFLPEKLQDWIAVASSVLTTVAVLFGVWNGLRQWSSATEQRKDELNQRELEFRHKQAIFARELVNAIFADPLAHEALIMLAGDKDTFKSVGGETFDVSRSELQKSLRVSRGVEPYSGKELFIRSCFEALYDQLEEVEKLIELTVIDAEDVETVFRYYMLQAKKPEIQHREFLEYFDYPNALTFLERFSESASKPGASLSPGSR